MINPEASDRLARNIVEAIATPQQHVESSINRVKDFAIQHGLDIQDVATMFRIVSGEGTGT